MAVVLILIFNDLEWFYHCFYWFSMCLPLAFIDIEWFWPLAFIDFEWFYHSENMIFIIFSDTCFGNVFWIILAFASPFLASFRHQCWCFGVLVFNIICWLNFPFIYFSEILRPKMEPINRAVDTGACDRPPKIAFRRRHRSKDVFSSIRHRFWIDLAMISKPFPLGAR